MGTDGFLSHRGLLRLMQEAAALESDDRGFGFRDAREKGAAWVLAGWRLERKVKLPWRAAVEVRTWPRKVQGFLSERDFHVFAGDVLAARAASRWFLMDPGTGKLTRVTGEIRDAYEFSGEEAFPGEPLPSNGRTPAGAETAFETVAGRRDLDTNGHVNNICYLDYAMEALPPEVADDPPDTVEAVFRRQIWKGTRLQCLYARENGRHTVEIRSGEGADAVHHAYLWFYG